MTVGILVVWWSSMLWWSDSYHSESHRLLWLHWMEELVGWSSYPRWSKLFRRKQKQKMKQRPRLTWRSTWWAQWILKHFGSDIISKHCLLCAWISSMYVRYPCSHRSMPRYQLNAKNTDMKKVAFIWRHYQRASEKGKGGLIHTLHMCSPKLVNW